jgi:hypothetical protein
MDAFVPAMIILLYPEFYLVNARVWITPSPLFGIPSLSIGTIQ